MPTIDENASAIDAAKDYPDNVPAAAGETSPPWPPVERLHRWLPAWPQPCPMPADQRRQSQLPGAPGRQAGNFPARRDRATIRVTNPQGGQQTDVHIVANPGAIAIGLSSTDHTFARTTLFAPWEE